MARVVLIQDKFDKTLWRDWNMYMVLEGVFTYKFLYSNGEESEEYQKEIMTKLIDCPVCGKKGQPVREDAKVCSSSCRVKQWRLNKKEQSDD